MLTLRSPCCVLKDTIGGSMGNYATETLTPLEVPCTLLNRIALTNSTMGKCAPMQAVKQLSYGEVRTHANYETTSTGEIFQRRGTKLFLLSHEHNI